VHGYQIFRSREIVRDPRAEVDRFFATLPGDPALEVPVSQSTPGYQGLYTACFLDAFAHPPADLVVELDGNRVIPNRRLKPYLVTTVRKRAEESSITLRQVPDAILEAGDRAYIGRVDQQAVLASPSARRQSATTISEVARLELSRAGAFPSTPAPATSLAADIDRESTLVGFSDARNALQQAQRSWKFVKRTGIVVNGAAVKLLAMHPDHRASVLQDGHGRDPTLIEVDLADRPAASVFLGFADGSGTAVAALRDFVGTVVVADRRVVNVSYVPGENSGRWPEYQQDRDRLDGLHATVAASARFGVFRISGEAEDRTRQAAQLADSIRILKGIDPTLGIYAAYAYTDAGLIDRVRSVRQYMRGDLDADVFDVAMLAGELSKRDAGSPIVAPLCPMLSQGWSLLRARGVTLPKELEAARDNLRGALWTTFEPEGAAAVGAALRSGRFR
jgi:hypothetical protein